MNLPYHVLEKENVVDISLENGENYEKETQVTTNQDIPIIIQPQVVLTRFKYKDYENYIKNDR